MNRFLFWIGIFSISLPLIAENSPKKALIFGVGGQDGGYLAEFLLEKGYEVHGVRRRYSIQIGKKYGYEDDVNFILHYGDLADTSNTFSIISEIRPDEIYNLAGISQVKLSFDEPELTAEINALGTLRILEAIKQLNLKSKTKFYQASTSELYGSVGKEGSALHPCSPYATSKLFAYWATINYREAFGLFACNGILFNHESPRRGEDFVSSKIVKSAVEISQGRQEVCVLGNLNAQRDWGYAKDYVEAMWAVLQEEIANDFVIATGEMHSVREFVEAAFREVGIEIEWSGEGIDEIGIDKTTKKIVVQVDPKYFRPVDPPCIGSNIKQKENLFNWRHKTSFADLVKILVFDYQNKTLKGD
jgi:GDPmannose 4,6-dehydratase